MDFWLNGIWWDYLKPGVVVMVLAMAGALLVDLCCRAAERRQDRAAIRRAFLRARLEPRPAVVRPFPSDVDPRYPRRDLPVGDSLRGLRTRIERRRVERADEMRWIG